MSKSAFLLFPLAITLVACSSNKTEGMLICGLALPVCIKQAVNVKKDPNCEHEPKPIIPDQVHSKTIALLNIQALPWLNPIKYPTLSGSGNMTFEYLAPLLSYTKFEAIELKAPVQNNGNGDFVGLSKLAPNLTNVNWVRVSLKSRGHPLCNTYEMELEKNKSWLPESIKKSGIHDNQCIAVEIIDSPNSQYGFDVVNSPRNDERSNPQIYWIIRDLKQNTIFAEIIRHTSIGIDCPSIAVRHQFVRVVNP